MILHHNLRRNNKGIGTVFGMVFFILIVMVVFASFVIILNQNTSLEQTTAQAKQLDLDRYTELQTVSITDPEIAVSNGVVYISCTIVDNGTLPTQLVRLWIKDVTTNTVGNVTMIPSLNLQPGSGAQYFNFTRVANAGILDQFSFWFITARGNTISAFPNTNQLNGIAPIGTFPGVSSINSTYSGDQTPLHLSLNTTKPNQLIYVVVSFDDGNTLYTPTSSPSLTWTLRTTSLPTDQNSGDSILKTFYAIDPSVGPITINIQSTADELSDYYCSALAFAISDVNTANPFDGSAQTSIGRSTMPQDTINTHYSNDFIIGAVGIDSLNPAITPGGGFGEIMPVQSSFGASGADNAQPRSVWSEWAIMGDFRNNLPVNCSFTTTKDWAIIVDAVRLVVVPPTSPMSLSPTSGPIGTPVTVSGQGFAANSQLIATFDGSQIPFSYTTDGSGNIPSGAIFTVPQGATPGLRTVNIIDSKFNFAPANFTVTTPGITVTPQTGPVGTTLTVTGSNFIASSTIAITLDGNSVTTNPVTVSANPVGGFSATFMVSGTAGVKPILASDGINSVSANFAVTPSITLNPTQGPKNTLVTVFGNGFAANSNVGITFGGSPVSTTPATLSSNSSGYFNATFTVPPLVGNNPVVATDAGGNSASLSFTETVSIISLAPTAAKVGATITVSGSNFITNSPLSVMFDGTVITTATASITGSIPAGVTFVVPATTAGAHIVTCSDSGNNIPQATLTVTPNTLLTPTSGPYGTSVSISGQGFAASSTLTLSFAGASIATSPSPIQTDNLGSFSGSFIVPSSSAGAKTVLTSDGTNSYPVTFTVTTRSITLNPTTGSNGTTVTVTGSNFEPTQAVALNFDATALTTFPEPVISSGTGAFSCTFNVPNSASGSHTVYAGDTVPNAASATFTVVASALTLNPSSGAIGTSVTVSGSNYLPNSALTVTYDGVTVASSTSTGSGAIPSGVSFPVPPSIFGGHIVKVADAYGNSATATFTVSASLTLNPANGLIGTNVAVSGQGFAASSTITLTFGGSGVTTVPTPVQTDVSGSFTCSFTVPSIAPGAKSVTATDLALHSASATFTLTAPTLSLSPTTGPIGTSVTLTGSSFTPNSAVTVTFGGNALTTNPASITSSGTGTFSATFTVPSSTSGAQTVTAIDDATNSGSATFTVATSSISLSPSNGPVATSITVSGSNFIPNSALTIRYDGSIVATPTASATGAIPAGVTFNVPASIAGAHTVQASDGTNTVSATFTVTPKIILNPISGKSGITVTISGTGFAGTRTITATFAGSAVTLSGTTTTDVTGSFSAATFTVPASTPGSKTVAVTDAGTNAASATFTVNPPLGLDGSASTNTLNGNTMTITLTTTNANDVLYLSFVGSSGTTITSVSSSGTSAWTQRASFTYSGTHYLQTYYATRTTSGTTTITINLNGNGNCAAEAFGVSGADITSAATIFDGNARTNTNTGTAASVSITTANSNELVIGALGAETTTNPTVGAGFTIIRTQAAGGSRLTSDEYQLVSTPQALTARYTISSADWGMVAEAIKSAP